MNRLKYILLLVVCLVSVSLRAQPLKQYSVVSLMNGEATFYTDSNTLIDLPVWGYGWDNASPVVVLPAPTIYAKEGDSVHLAMSNPSMEGHTIHLHGLDVDEANDGVPHYSGFILQGDSFTYRFKATHAGNFLYHCHVTTTMHLTLGMYGMVIVYPADSSNRIYTNGPAYDVQHEYLLSDMDARWNADYTTIGGFLTYDPDLYLINGKNKDFIYSDTHMTVMGGISDQHLLRFLNVGYRVNRVIFPSEIEAVVHTSDGRVLPSSFQTDTLIIYPGERYSVLAEINSEDPSSISIDYLDPYRLTLLGREYIPVNDSAFSFVPYSERDVLEDSIGVGTEDVRQEDLLLYPNPFTEEFNIVAPEEIERIQIINQFGHVVLEKRGLDKIETVSTAQIPTGIYIIAAQLASGKEKIQMVVKTE